MLTLSVSAPWVDREERFHERCRGACCRSCGQRGLVPVLDMGDLPLADGWALPVEPLDGLGRHPVALAACRGCKLLQLLDSVSPQLLYCRGYPYCPEVPGDWAERCRRDAAALAEAHGLGAGSLAIQIASHDGRLLGHLQERGVAVLGIEPAQQPTRAARNAGVPTLNAFFERSLAAKLHANGRQADLVVASGVLPHVPDLDGFVSGVARLLKPRGAAVFEVPYVIDMIQGLQFDAVRHEHLSYFSAASLRSLLVRNGLHPVAAERRNTQGGSLRVTCRRERPGRPPASLERMLAEERARGLGRSELYASFARRVKRLRVHLRQLLDCLRGRGKRIAALGAAPEGTVLLDYLGLDRATVEYVIDRSPHKVGKLVPGTGIPIHPPSRLREDRPDYLLLLPQELRRKELLIQQRGYLAAGGKFILPLPRPEVVEGGELPPCS